MSTTQLSGRELDAAIAERVMDEPQCVWWRLNGAGRWSKACDHKKCYPAVSKGAEPLIYIADMNANRIAELGLRNVYLRKLGNLVHKTASKAGEELDHWHYVHATAEQRCRAALAAIEGS
jgi:hypothetical protein